MLQRKVSTANLDSIRVLIDSIVFKKQRMPFKTYFDKTQRELSDKFGMEMCELPTKEKITMKEKLGE